MTVHVVGNAARDVTYRLARLPAAGETLLARGKSVDLGGKGLNQAVAAARAGAAVRLSCAIGDDDGGAAIAAALHREPQIELDVWRRDLPSDESVIAVADDGENLIISTAACAASVTPAEAVAAVAGAAAGDVLAMQGNLSARTTLAALAAAHAAGLVTVLNPAPLAFDVMPMLRHVHCLVANEGEAAGLGEPAALAGKLAGGGALIVTLGARGACVHRAGRPPLAIAAPRVEARDTAGAGDAFVGTLAAGLSLGVSLEPALEAATRAAASVVTRPGTYRALAALTPPGWPLR